MLKLIKYEWKKEQASKWIILILAGLIELYFLYGIAVGNVNHQATGWGLQLGLAMCGLLFISFESILTFSKDLKTKQGYLLFMIPKTSYSIVGAKVLSAGIQIFVAGLAFFALIAGDFVIMGIRNEGFARTQKLLSEVILQFLHIDLNILLIFLIFLELLFVWLLTITSGFFSITLSSTFLANKKWKGVVSFIIFILIMRVFSFILDKINNLIHYDLATEIPYGNMVASIIFSVLVTIAIYLGTSYMLEKKVSM